MPFCGCGTGFPGPSRFGEAPGTPNEATWPPGSGVRGDPWDGEFTRPGKHTKNYGKSPFLMGKSTINGNFLMGKSPFSIATLNYQRVREFDAI